MASKVSIKIFLGCLITSEINMHLTYSINWKLAKIEPSNEMQLVNYQGKEYIGCFLETSSCTMAICKKMESMVKQRLHDYCPEFETENLNVTVFPQVFIA
ncbi:MAG: hypothetical protein WCG42_09475 [Parachlamydiaceae bacterium]